MAETLANGTVVPQGSDPIHGSGVQAMRNLGGSVDGQLGNRYTKAQADALLEGKASSSHTHPIGDVTGLTARLAALEQDTGTRITTENLDTLTRTGVYYQLSNVNATLARNYPITTAGRLTVTSPPAGESQWVFQEYTTYSQGWPKTWRRNRNASTWGVWRLMIDELELADRLKDYALEQDTGDRDITSLVPNLVAGSGHWTIRRTGGWVYTNLYSLTFTPTSGSTWIQAGFFPVGFRPPAASQYVRFPAAPSSASESSGPFRVDRYGGATLYNVGQGVVHVTASWPTNDAFPTTLPGTPA